MKIIDAPKSFDIPVRCGFCTRDKSACDSCEEMERKRTFDEIYKRIPSKEPEFPRMPTDTTR